MSTPQISSRFAANLSVGVLALTVIAVAPSVFAAGKMMMSSQRVTLMPLPPAKGAGLGKATGFADVDVKKGTVRFSMTLAKGTSLPKGTVLEGWLSTSGKSTASMADQKFGPAFGKKDLATKSRAIPYALSTGVLHSMGKGVYGGTFKIANNLTPYGAVAVTLESDGNAGLYDPRPGTPMLAGPIKAPMMTR